MLQSTFLKIPIFIYFVINLSALFSQKILTFSPKTIFFKRKHDFSRKLEGGTWLQGVSSNLNVKVYFWHLDFFFAKDSLFWFFKFLTKKIGGYTIFKYPSYKHHKHLQHHQDHRHHQHPYHQHKKHRPASLYLFQTVAVSYYNSSFWDRSWECLFLQNFFELKSPMKNFLL